MKVKVFGKINLVLNILGKEKDMHVLDMLNTSISLYDEIDVKVREDEIINIDITSDDNTLDKDLYCKAVKGALDKFFNKYGKKGLDISIVKNIPLGAGLGGGSAPVVGVLKCLYLSINKEPDNNELLTYGSDVPYMWKGGFARVSHLGEIVEPLGNLNVSLVIAKPNSGIDTKDSYDLYDKIAPKKDSVISIDDMLDGEFISFQNALEKPSTKLNIDILTLEKLINKNGFDCCMTGSGSGVFFLVYDAESADKVRFVLESEKFWTVCCNSVNTGIVTI